MNRELRSGPALLARPPKRKAPAACDHAGQVELPELIIDSVREGKKMFLSHPEGSRRFRAIKEAIQKGGAQ